MSDLKLFVWEGVLRYWEEGIVVVCAHSEAEAWDVLEEKDYNAWHTLRYGDDSETTYVYLESGEQIVEELRPMRPRIVNTPEAFVVEGGSG